MSYLPRQSTVDSQWSKTSCGFSPGKTIESHRDWLRLLYLRPAICNLSPFFSSTFPLSTRNSFVLCNIPAFLRVAESRSFVFIDIPASVVQILKSLLLLSPNWTTRCLLQPSVLLFPTSLSAHEDLFSNRQCLCVLCDEEKLNTELTEILRGLCVEALKTRRTRRSPFGCGHRAALCNKSCPASYYLLQ